MGESQIGGSIIGLFLDLMREAFQNSWGPMEDLLGVQQEEIGCQCCNLNLLKEMMGKIGELHKDGKVRYPVDVSYNMGWQKAKKVYDSISGHGLMIGNATKNVVQSLMFAVHFLLSYQMDVPAQWHLQERLESSAVSWIIIARMVHAMISTRCGYFISLLKMYWP
jgi:hypothetical protein